MNPDDLLDIKEAAAFLHVSGTSLRRWTNEGLLPCLRVGRRRERRFRRSDLLAFMEVEPALAVTEVTARRDADGMAPLDGRSEHLCALYSTDAGRTRLAAAFLADGLHDGSQCFLIAERSVREAIVTRLRRDRAALPDGFDESRLV